MTSWIKRILAGLFVASFAGDSHGGPPNETATFAGGCFWCMEPPFEKLTGVVDVVSGYMGGTGANPTYEDYAQKGYAEVVQVTYDPSIISYDKLLNAFWRQINPTDAGGQFVDRGPQYRSVIYYHTEVQKQLAEKSKKELGESKIFEAAIVTEILAAGTFYKAEDYHQDYYKTHTIKYKYYRHHSGRDAFLDKTWGADRERKDPTAPLVKATALSDEELKKKLTPLQYKVTRQNGTEPPFKNEYAENKREGIYVDIVSGEPLFSSTDKFDSGTGWPSFTKPLDPSNIVERVDKSLFATRTEIRSRLADNHIGHVFNDGPPPTGLRYCMNSAALRFVPKEEMEREGYGRYLEVFEPASATK